MCVIGFEILIRCGSALRESINRYRIMRKRGQGIAARLGDFILSAAIIVKQLFVSAPQVDIQHILMDVRLPKRSDIKAQIGRIRIPSGAHHGKTGIRQITRSLIADRSHTLGAVRVEEPVYRCITENHCGPLCKPFQIDGITVVGTRLGHRRRGQRNRRIDGRADDISEGFRNLICISERMCQTVKICGTAENNTLIVG